MKGERTYTLFYFFSAQHSLKSHGAGQPVTSRTRATFEGHFTRHSSTLLRICFRAVSVKENGSENELHKTFLKQEWMLLLMMPAVDIMV